jgi:heterodisulfide reductase subunit A2
VAGSPYNSVAIIGGGVAGLAAAEILARSGLLVELFEKNATLGGHAAQFTCKATERCVKCGACTVNDFMRRTSGAPTIRFHLNSTIESIVLESGFTIISAAESGIRQVRVDAVLLATGFQAFDPRHTPYGYGHLQNVLTNLDVERRLKRDLRLTRPSDGKPPQKLAFIQCVGSRDAQLHHLWCSKVCCSSALRMAQRIRHLHQDTQVTLFYIDIQTFGKDFQMFYERMRKDLRFVRAIPGDIVAAEDNGCKISYFDPTSGRAEEAVFDMAVLSVGVTPGADHPRFAQWLKWPLSPEGFFDNATRPPGIFSAGAATGPMNIAESIASSTRAAWQIVEFLGQRGEVA